MIHSLRFGLLKTLGANFAQISKNTAKYLKIDCTFEGRKKGKVLFWNNDLWNITVVVPLGRLTPPRAFIRFPPFAASSKKIVPGSARLWLRPQQILLLVLLSGSALRLVQWLSYSHTGGTLRETLNGVSQEWLNPPLSRRIGAISRYQGVLLRNALCNLCPLAKRSGKESTNIWFTLSYRSNNPEP